MSRIKNFISKNRKWLLKINDFLPIFFGYGIYLLPDGEIKTIALILFTAIYGGPTARYYLPKK